MPEKKQCLHANALRLGEHGVLIIGDSGSGKSVITLALIDRAGWSGRIGKLVSDDYTDVVACDGHLIGSAPDRLRGGMEVRGAGLFAMDFDESVTIDLVVTLGNDHDRYPADKKMTINNVDVAMISLPGLDKADGLAICQAIEAACCRTKWDKPL